MRYPWQKLSSVEALAACSLTVFLGSGGGVALAAGGAAAAVDSTRRVLVFKLDGHAQLPAAQLPALATTSPPPDSADANTVAAGAELFGRYCSACHGQSAVSGASRRICVIRAS